MPKKFTPAQIAYFAREESDAARLYTKYGFHSFARDEARHARYFKDVLKKIKKKR